MAKGKRVTVRLDDKLDAIINQACINENCDKTTILLSAIRKGLAIAAVAKPDKPTSEAKLVVTEDEPSGRPKTRVVLEEIGSDVRMTGMMINGVEWKYCEKCKLFYRRDELGRMI
jgi:hypothetical protein